MINYKKIYVDHFGYGEQDFIPCEMCGNIAVDVHHILFKSHGGKNEIENLAALCRECHNCAHEQKTFNKWVRKRHNEILKKYEK